MNPSFSFNKAAATYPQVSTMQRSIAQNLLQLIPDQPATVLDIGCGDGAVYESISWPIRRFVGVDGAGEMLVYHPKAPEVELYCRDFLEIDSTLGQFDAVISSSALHWCEDLERLAECLALMVPHCYLALFTGASLGELHRYLGVNSPLPSAMVLQQCLSGYFALESQIERYELSFENGRALAGYLRNSGVGGGYATGSFAKLKKLINDSGRWHVSFEVLYLKGKSRRM